MKNPLMLMKIYIILSILFLNFFTYAALPLRNLPANLSDEFQFSLLTPTGESLFRNSVLWESLQIDSPKYPMPAQCAANISKVFRMSGFLNYSGQSVAQLLQSLISDGGRFYKFPKTKNKLIEKINTIYGGKIPAGTIVGGCLYADCFSGQKGERHSAIVSNIDSDGNILIYHNNWYRPENENGKYKEHMISKLFLEMGFKRQWMQTPWIRLIRDTNNKVIDVISLVPKIDDMDPFQYYLTLVVPGPIYNELKKQFDFNLFSVSEFFAPNIIMDLPPSDPFDIEFDDNGSRL